jgi:alanine racemase
MPLGRLTIDLAAIIANWQLLAALSLPAQTGAVVKADAYGLGLQPVAKALADAGCDSFWVATLDEAVALRQLLPRVRIAVLGDQVEPNIQEFIGNRLTPVLNHPGAVEAWQRWAAPAAAWLHLDTGMHRLGLSPSEWQALQAGTSDWQAAGIGGLMSHYACADDPDHPQNAQQRDRALAAANASGLRLSLGNSSGIYLGAEFRGDTVRPGMALYGLNPTPHTANPMQRVVTLEVQVLQVRQVDAEAGAVGYGASAAATPGQTLATVALGYADGLHRALSGKGQVFFAGQVAPIVGRVSMDSIVVDVSHITEPVRPGDWAEVIGPNQSADALADMAGTIGYEILTSLGARYVRSYLPSGTD